LALIGLLILAAPTLARYALVKLVSDRLQVQVSIEDVDLNIFDGEARIRNLFVEGDHASSLGGAQLYADLDMGALLTGDLVAEAIRLDGLRLQVVRSSAGEIVVVVPLVAQAGGEEEAPAELPLFELQELTVTDTEVDVDLEPVRGRFTVKEMTLRNLTTRQPAPAQLSLAADWNGARLAVDGSLAPFEEAPWFEGELSLQGADLEELDPYLPAPLAGLDGGVSMRWQGRLGVERVALQGDLRLDEATVGLQNLAVTGSALSWQGTVAAGGFADALEFVVAGEVTGTRLGIADEARGVTLFELGELHLEDLKLDQRGALEIARLEFGEMRAVDRGSEEQRLLQAQAIRIRALAYRDNTLDVGAIASEGVASSLYLTPAGDLVARGVLTTSLEGLRESGEAADESEPLKWRLGEVSAQNSRVTVVDQQFDPPFTLKLAVERLQLGELDSTRPELPMPISLKSQVGEYGRFDLEGEMTALAPATRTALKGRIDSLPLPMVSPYIESILGYELVAGQFDHDFDFTVVESHVEASNELNLRKLRVEKLENAQPTAPLPVPLGYALDMLRDSDDHIALSVPLEGELDDPAFGLDQIISRALGKALRAGSTAYLKFALQPYGAIWTGVEMGMKMAGKMRLDPMPFPAGSAELGELQLDYAAKLAQILADRPNLHLELCGEAGRDDFSQLAQAGQTGEAAASGQPSAVPAAEQREQMLALAEARADTLKRWLVSEKGIEPARLYPCKPAADPEAEVSGVLLSL
jgi:hypothetical protein